VKIEVDNFGGDLRGNCFKIGLFGYKTDFNFHLAMSRGGLEKLVLDMTLHTRNVNGKDIPSANIEDQ
jgi:hypothetical protein